MTFWQWNHTQTRDFEIFLDVKDNICGMTQE